MKTTNLKYAIVATLVISLSACVVAPSQPIGYRMTSTVLPTYVNGQYVGMQPSNYMIPSTPAADPVAAPITTAGAQPATPPAPVYLQATTPSVVYVQAPAPVYTYNPYYGPSYYPYGAYPYSYPYYSPYYAPWFGGIGFGLGVRVRIHR